jgi:general secretion pathway protein D
MPEHLVKRGTLFCAISLLLAGCATHPANNDVAPAHSASEAPLGMTPGLSDAVARAQGNNEPDRSRIYRGSGVVVKGQEQGGAVPPAPPPVQFTGNAVVLNFEGADLREVVRNILGDILNESYTIDPAVGGQVTIRTTAGVPRDSLPATLEMLLRMNGATMIKDGPVWKIVPQANAVRGNVTPQLGGAQRALPPGFSVRIVPLRYIGVRDMAKILEPFARDASTIRTDDVRNLLILAGTEQELQHLLQTVDMFDIDWMAGMSAGIFTLQNADVKSVMQEFGNLLSDQNSPLAGILRVIPIERMNAILVISPNGQYLEEAKKWIERLDAGSGEGVRFYVYNLQSQRAELIGPLLQQAFTGQTTQPIGTTAPTVAPGTPAGQIVSPPSFMAQPSVPVANPVPTPAAAAAAGSAIGAAVGAAAGTARGVAGEGGVGVVRNIQVVANKDQNTILIVATPSQYSIIEQALRKLDVPARQVMMEVTIAEVQLTDALTYGIEWLFKGGAPGGRGSGGFFFPSGGTAPFNPGPVGFTPPSSANNTTVPAMALTAGFNYILNSANFLGGVQAVLHMLDTFGNTKVIANPHIAALDNQKATIKSGDRIPINQQTLVGGTTNAVTTTSQYIDTGVLLQVTPHINAGGLVTLDVQAEVSNPGTPAAAGDAPPISTRSVQTIVAVPSGRTMVMGGLIRDNKINTTNGFPLLDRIPVLGGLFGKTDLNNSRSELVVFITPRVVESSLDAESIINDLRRRMEMLDRTFPATSTWPASPPSVVDRFERSINPYRWQLPLPTEPKPLPPPVGQPTQTPAPGEPASAATPVPGAQQPINIAPPPQEPAPGASKPTPPKPAPPSAPAPSVPPPPAPAPPPAK